MARRPYRYPLDRTQERIFPPDFSGRIYVWDIDKTYLASDIDSLRGLLAIPLEFAVDKRNVAGTPALLRALRRGTADEGLTDANPIYFVSASPPQLRSVIERKMLLDGVEYDGITFKDQLWLARRAKFGKLREQIGYKLSALLLNRMELPADCVETLFGDDSEADGLIYSMYADIVAGRLRGEQLQRTLLKRGVRAEDAAYVRDLADEVPAREMVGRVYINLENKSDPSRFADFGPSLVPCWDTFQMALSLYEDGHLLAPSVGDVGAALIENYGRNAPSLLRSAADLVSRGHLGLANLQALWPTLVERELAPDYFVVDEARRDEHPPAPAPKPGAMRTPKGLIATV